MPTNSELLEQTNTANGLNNPSMAVGVGGIVDWNDALMFLDITKMMRPYTKIVDGEYLWFPDLEERGYFEDSLDENGWPTYIPEAMGDFSTMWHWERDDQFADAIGQHKAGTYVLRYEGEGTLSISGGPHINILSQEDGQIVFENTTGEIMFMTISETDPNGNGDYIRDVSIVKEEYVELFDAGATFDPEFLDAYGEMRELRYMDMVETNNSHVSELSDRPQVDDFTYMGGAPIEVIVDLANQTGTDVWLNIPHLATDEYIQFMAEYVHDHLDPNLKVTVEYSNEAWNSLFQHAHEMQALGLEAFEGADNHGYFETRLSYYGMRASEAMKIFTDEFGEGNDQLVRVVGSETTWPWLGELALEAPVWQSADPENYVAPHTYFDAIAVTTYFGAEIVSNEEYVQQILDAIADPDVDANQLLYNMLRDPNVGSSLVDVRNGLEAHANLVDQYGMKLVSYEGGQHVHHLFGTDGAGLAINDFMIEFVRSQEMADLYQELWDMWAEYGDGPFMHFGLVGAPGIYGSWALQATYDDSTARSDLFLELNATDTPDWEDRGGEHFQQGVYETGTDSHDILFGTTQEDFLAGGAGNDLLVGGEGNDGFNGGEGNDTVLLSGSRADYHISAEDVGYRLVGLDGSDYAINVEVVEFEDGTQFELATMDLDEGESPVIEDPVDDTPVDEEPIDEEPVDETPVDDDPVDEEPVDTGVSVVKNYFFGHSLILHATDTPETTVPHWMHEFADAAGNEFAYSGQYGFFPNTTPIGQWGAPDRPYVWDDDGNLTFAEVDFTTVTMTVANFIQYKGPTEPLDGDNPEGNTPVGLTLESIDFVLQEEPGADIIIYENWPDMGGFVSPFPPTEGEFASYNAYTQGEFHNWWVEFYNELTEARPDANIIMLPVGPILSKLFTETVVQDVPVTDLYEDDAPHGTETLYFLASIVNYAGTYGERPPVDFEIPDTVHSIVRDNYEDIVDFVWDELISFDPTIESPIIDEEPVDEEPVDEEPVDEEPVDEEPVDEEPVDEEPVDEEPVDEEPVDEEPVDEEPVDEEPVDEEPVDEEPVDEEPVDEVVTIQGDADDNFFGASAATEIFNGGAGDDIVSYGGSSEGVFVRLDGNASSQGDAAGDILNDIEVVLGSNHDDVLLGSAGVDSLFGNDGDDYFDSGAGDDQLFGGAGNDTYRYTEGYKGIYDSEGYNTLVFGAGIIPENVIIVDNTDIIFADRDGGLYVQEGVDHIDTFYFDALGTAMDLNTLLSYQVVDEEPVDETPVDDTPAEPITAEYYLVDTTTDEFIAELSPDMEIDGALLEGKKVSLVVQTDSPHVSSVAMSLNGADAQIESHEPYALFGDNGWSDFKDGTTLSAGEQTLSIVLYNEDYGNGTVLGELGISFTVTEIEPVVEEEPVDEGVVDNVIEGTEGEDYLFGTSDRDLVNAGEGDDWMIYWHSENGIMVNLKTGVNVGGDADGDVLNGIDGIIGSNHDDVLFGSDSGDELKGWNGDDVIIGGGGADVLGGGAGADKFIFDYTNLTDADYIVDFNAEEGDYLELSDLMGSYNSDTDVLTDYLQIVSDEYETFVSVNVDGQGDEFTLVVVLNGSLGTDDESLLVESGAIII